MYQFKVGVCMLCVGGGVGVGGALKNSSEMVGGGVLKVSFVFKGGP